MKNDLLLSALLALPSIAFAADLSGIWKSEFDSQIGQQKYTYALKQEGDKLTGKANSEINDQKRETPLSEGKVEGDKVSFVEMLNFNGNDIRIAYSGTISSNEMKITREVGTFAKEDIILKRDAEQPAGSASGQRGPRAGRGFGGPITLGPDDKAAFPTPPEGFDKPREGIPHGKIETVQYDFAVRDSFAG